jgi:hypothetical protein
MITTLAMFGVLLFAIVAYALFTVQDGGDDE